VVDGSTRDVERARFDVAVDNGHDPSQRPPRRPLLRRRAEQTPPAADVPATRRRRRRSPLSVVLRLLKRLWIPLVVLAVIIAGGFTVSRLHSIFGTVNSMSYGDTRVDDNTPVNPKHLKYEVFGPPGTVAQISYFDENGNPKYLKEVSLPWTLEFPMTTAAGVGSVAAQGNSDSLGCRILVDDVVKSETIKEHAVSTFTSCMLKAA
jgi:hypothetical protein